MKSQWAVKQSSLLTFGASHEMFLRVTLKSITKHMTICCVCRPSSRSHLIFKLKCGLCRRNFSMLLTLKWREKSDRRHPHQNIIFHSVCVLVWLKVSSFGAEDDDASRRTNSSFHPSSLRNKKHAESE